MVALNTPTKEVTNPGTILEPNEEQVSLALEWLVKDEAQFDLLNESLKHRLDGKLALAYREAKGKLDRVAAQLNHSCNEDPKLIAVAKKVAYPKFLRRKKEEN